MAAGSVTSSRMRICMVAKLGHDAPDTTLYLRRYEYTHHSTGVPIRNGPWIQWGIVKQPRPGDFEFKMVGRYDGTG